MLAAIDNWLFILLAALAGLFQLLSKAAAAKRNADTPDESMFPPPDQNTPPPARPSSNEEQIRKFLEALGQPRTAKVPPPLPPRKDVEPRPVAPVRPPASAVPIPEWPKKRAEPRRVATPRQAREKLPPPVPSSFVEPPVPRARPAESPVFEVQDPTAPVTDAASSKTAAPTSGKEQGITDLVHSLRSTQGLRHAIILREIFGQPRSLRSLEEDGVGAL